VERDNRGQPSEYIEIPRLGAVIETTRARTVSAKSGRICSGIYRDIYWKEWIGIGLVGKRGGIASGSASAHLVRIGLQ